ncbi:MAG TPA: cupin domain-containing protein [Bacteroidales bacterium]|nr:cupin domain-containing protein [Bacteroidales bacterium]HQI69835.1 cupin domain-containing protein [Bacteroidales bacterium]
MKKIIIQQLSDEEIQKIGIHSWPVWTKEISRFDWYYDNEEACLILEGEIVIETSENQYTIHAGDFVTFRKGLQCVWNIKKPVRKHYQFK